MPLSNTTTDAPHLSRIQVFLGGVHEANYDYVCKRLCERIDGLIACQFIDDNNQADISYDTDKLDQYALLTAIQRLGHPVQLVNSQSVQCQLRIEGMHCNSCVSNICGAILDLPGAADIQLTFLDKLATISYDPSILQLDEIIAEIEKLGFQVAISNAEQLGAATESSSSKFLERAFATQTSVYIAGNELELDAPKERYRARATSIKCECRHRVAQKDDVHADFLAMDDEIKFRQAKSTRRESRQASLPKEDHDNELETCYFTVLGMTCASCVDSIQRNLGKVEGTVMSDACLNSVILLSQGFIRCWSLFWPNVRK